MSRTPQKTAHIGSDNPGSIRRDSRRLLFKDAVLDELSTRANVAQFVSFGPHLEPRFGRLSDSKFCLTDYTREESVARMLEASRSGTVNVRSFDPTTPESQPFRYGLKRVDEVLNLQESLAAAGLYTIVNETVNVHDAGVSGVLLGDVIEFAPQDTPRAVEKPGAASLPRSLGLTLLERVYGFRADLDRYEFDERVEFSIHPIRQGIRNTHTLVWQIEKVDAGNAQARLGWPNRFSEFIGDKVFGLLIAHVLGFLVPRTTVFCRNVAPFTFGERTGTDEPWLRTSPKTQVAGKYYSGRGWQDPFNLMSQEDSPDPSGATVLASILAQEGVDARYSGAALTGLGNAVIIEGVQGFGDAFMLGGQKSELPIDVQTAVQQTVQKANSLLGAVRCEWVFDGRAVWVVQMHRGGTSSTADVIVPGVVDRYIEFDASAGIEELRRLISEIIKQRSVGIILRGRVGVTSHFGDLLRRAGIPSKIVDS
jgi:hypothetical protein